jgi:hypothetical protein
MRRLGPWRGPSRIATFSNNILKYHLFLIDPYIKPVQFDFWQVFKMSKLLAVLVLATLFQVTPFPSSPNAILRFFAGVLFS